MKASLMNGSAALRGCCRLSQSLHRLHNPRATLTSPLIGSVRCMASAAEQRDITAAPEIPAELLVPINRLADHARAVPVSPSYFSRQPRFNDSYLVLQRLLRSYDNLPLAAEGSVERIAWKTLQDYRQTIGEPVKTSDFVKCMEVVKRLHQIHPKLKPKAVLDAVEVFKRDIQPFSNVAKPIIVDQFGRALGVGRRKTSVARAWVVEGTGEVQVNGKSLAEAFGRVHDRESAVWALRSTGRIDKYNVWALVEGGGTTGQAEALTLAVSKALMAHEPALKPALRRGKMTPRPTPSHSLRCASGKETNNALL